MTKRKRTKLQILGLISLSLIIATVTYGFAEASSLGSTGLLSVEYGVVSDHQVSLVTYTLDVNDPTAFTAVSFQLEDQPAAVQAGVSDTKSGQVTWADSCEKTGYNWTCYFDGSISVLAADWLHVQ